MTGSLLLIARRKWIRRWQ